MDREGVRRRAVAVVCGAALLATALACMAATAVAATSFGACSDSVVARCGRVSVPLDRSGAVPGTIDLAVRIEDSLRRPASDRVVLVLADSTGELPGLSDASYAGTAG